MSSLRPKEGGSGEQPHYTPVKKPVLPLWIPILLIVLVVALAGIAYAQFSAKSSLEKRVNDLEAKLQENVSKLEASNTALASDIDVVTKKVGVTDKELVNARAFAEKLRLEHEKSLEAQKQLASTVEKKADSAEVAAARAEAASKVAEVQKESDTKITSVSGEVKTVATDLATTRQDLASSKRDIQDVRTTLSAEIAKNASELATLRQKGERNYFDIDLKKGKKNEMQRVGDVRLELRGTDTKKKRYDIVIQVDDSKLEKNDRLINEPLQFLVGADQQRYEIVVNKVEKDRIVGYLSTPKNKALSAERPATR
jgi:septation ring formation regulator EzrA